MHVCSLAIMLVLYVTATSGSSMMMPWVRFGCVLARGKKKLTMTKICFFLGGGGDAVSKVTEDEVGKRQAYLLMYTRRD